MPDSIEEIFKYFFTAYNDNDSTCQIYFDEGIKIVVDDEMIPIFISLKGGTIKYQDSCLGGSKIIKTMHIESEPNDVFMYTKEYMNMDEVSPKKMRYIANDNGWFYSGHVKCKHTKVHSFMFSPDYKHYFTNGDKCRRLLRLMKKQSLNVTMV